MEGGQAQKIRPANLPTSREHLVADARPDKRNRNHRKARLEQIRKASRMPHLPRGDYKIVIRLCGGLKISEHGIVHITAAVQDAAGTSRDERSEDIVCPNNYQNILIVSTSDQEHANKYQEVARVKIQDKFYETNAYETVPGMTTKEVIRGIALDEGPRDITAAVVTKKIPTAIAAKRIRQRGSDVPCTGNKCISVTSATNLDTKEMYVPTPTTRFVLDVEQQTQTKTIGANLNASYAARTIHPQIRRAKPNSRSPSSLNRDNGKDCNENYNKNMKTLPQQKTGQTNTTTTVSWADAVDSARPGAGGDTAINNKIKELKHENAQLRITLARMSDEIKNIKEGKSQLNQVTPYPHARTKDATEIPDNKMDEGDDPPPLKRKAQARSDKLDNKAGRYRN
ncbi:hypothetical protein HPB49_016555 [Dermacentor silvarum]|uniref:Uncharacterized protein n=1 Tax=Dermacentor silvarum TaxID=543639 RepID=A0ACB8DE68_DERSI|nr:hypothetical protein HPB49_016555 [Dermacentor silvarum]